MMQPLPRRGIIVKALTLLLSADLIREPVVEIILPTLAALELKAIVFMLVIVLVL